jgi:type IV fimbrial biogenesis protein FimT
MGQVALRYWVEGVLRIQVDLQILGKLRCVELLQHVGVPARHIKKHLCPSPHKLGSIGGKSQIFVRVYLSRAIGGVCHSGRALGVRSTVFSQMLSSLRLRNGVDTFFTSVLLTRSEAVKRNSRVVMCKSDQGKVCASSGDWNQGWIIFHDANNNAEVDAGESIVRHQQSLENRIKITGNEPVQKYVSYTGFGTSNLVSGAFQAGTLTFCQISPSPTDAWQIVINKTGRPRSVKTTVKQCI